MRAAILGTGYVGQAVARHWQGLGLQVTATTTRSERVGALQAVADRVQVVRGDDEAGLRQLLVDHDLLLVSVGRGRGASYEETYLRTAQTLARVLPDIPSLSQLLFTSTCSVYGNHQGQWVREDTPPQPATANAKIMIETEQVLLERNRPDLKVCILRLGGIYGPERDLARIFQRSAGSTRPGTGNSPSNWIHLDDIVGAIDFVRQHQLQGLYNLVQDEIPTIRALIDRVCHRHGLPAVTWDPSQPSSRSYNARIANQKIKAAGYALRHPSFDQLKD
ncbi:putative NAD-dependent epimerase [Halomicronema hongdechloris C2206]|uniref:NAD-dependent epimerase n=1 Tax=Halomicronema hongdechloris C2206 TaxID=1641165 RepID=A0A1Z3HUR7_9CYAN|nr:SDR family oxidoreductase [Halomicronema hongdechloris]ASC74012.1 putative NAD-dependent epimerase [Halomicronema hongdechloris C2206]